MLYKKNEKGTKRGLNKKKGEKHKERSRACCVKENNKEEETKIKFLKWDKARKENKEWKKKEER
jgi:hypothetical protein